MFIHQCDVLFYRTVSEKTFIKCNIHHNHCGLHLCLSRLPIFIRDPNFHEQPEKMSLNQLIYESILTASLNNITLPIELNNHSSITTSNAMIFTNNITQAENNNSPPLLFDDNKLWFQKKLTNYSKVIVQHSKTTNKTKKILGWNKNFGGGIRYD